MPVDNQHSDYAKYSPIWKRCRDAAAGQYAVHAAREAYLPKLQGEFDKEYTARLSRSSFFNAMKRTVWGLSSLLFRKPPAITVPDALNELLEDVTMSGVPLNKFVGKLADERLIVGRVGVIVDYPSVNMEGMTAAEASQLNLRPKLAMYRAE